jgi:membrane fusion protein, multidrug efflux system
MTEYGTMLSLTGSILSPRKLAAPVAILLGLALLGACSSESGPPPQTAVPAVIGKVESRTIPYQITAIGNVEAYNTISVKAQAGGTLKQVYFKEGQNVRRGDPLFLIDTAPYAAAMRQAEASLARDTVNARNAEENARRYSELVRKAYVTQQQYDDMVAQAEALKATVKGDLAALENARLNLGYCTISSPISGRTGSRLVDEGNIVKANADNGMVTILQIEPIYVSFSVPEKYLSEIRKESTTGSLKIRAFAPGEEANAHEGALTFVDNSVNSSTGTILLKATFPNEDEALWPGEFVNLELVLKELQNSVVVPSQTVQTGQNGEYVYVVKPDTTVEMRPVKVTYRSGNDAVIGEGLKPGETVVTDGQLRLYPGAKIAETTGLDTTGKANNQ